MENVECLWDLEIQAKKEMILSVSNVTFTNTMCQENRVDILVPGKKEPLFTECGETGESEKQIKLKKNEVMFGMLQVHVKFFSLKRGTFTLNWDYK